MTTHPTMTSTSLAPTFSSISSSSQANPIDLTADDDIDDIPGDHRQIKRMRMGSMPSREGSFCKSPWTPGAFGQTAQPLSATPQSVPPAGQPATQPFLNPSPVKSFPSQYRPVFAGPSSPANFGLPSSRSSPTPRPPQSTSTPSTDSEGHAPESSDRNNIIDLTGSPSPPPLNGPPQNVPTTSATGPELPDDLSPKTPVCIGQIAVNSLVLYPVAYLRPQLPGSPEPDWATVKLTYEHNPMKQGNQDTIHIKVPTIQMPNGELIQGENFAVVEQRVATAIGPMMGKGLIRLDGKARRGLPNLPILPLQILVYTPKGNIPVVGNYFRQHGLMLNHPTIPPDPNAAKDCKYYCNPHNPPRGGFRASSVGGRLAYAGPGGGRWTQPAVASRNVEVQRSQVDELFKSLRSGDELPETEPAPEIATQLYPHQKKALTFLLDREQEKPICEGKFTSLWQKRVHPISGSPSWYHVVTQREVYQEPLESKGAILADDMGLGKTITCVSLMAATIQSAEQFAVQPLSSPRPPERKAQSSDPLTAAHFAGTVWGMPDCTPSHSAAGPSSNAKGKAKTQKEQDKGEAEYARACRIKVRSRATLILCPLSTVSNWEEQFKEHWKGEVTVVGGGGGLCGATPLTAQGQTQLDESKMHSNGTFSGRRRLGRPLKVYVYHGNSRKPDPAYLADFDAVITTYTTLATEYSKQCKSATNDEDEDDSSDGLMEVDENGNGYGTQAKAKKKGGTKRKKGCGIGVEVSSPLQSVEWFRVVLDEAHTIKETSTVGSRASCDLIADRRLCLTGTPVQNKLDDVFALIKFLRLEPFDEKIVWTEFIGTPVKFGQPLGVMRLQMIMKCVTLRRTKESRAQDGQKILSLPPRRDELRFLKFDEEEQAIYDQFFNESKAEFNELSNKNEVMKNYVGILQKILRLRQICDHYELVKGKTLNGGVQPQDLTSAYDDIVAAIAREGIDAIKAAAVFALLKESGTTQCVECGGDLCVVTDVPQADALEVDGGLAPKRGKKSKGVAAASRASTRQNSPCAPRPVLTRCQHLFCFECYRNCICPGWPHVAPDVRRCCSACQTALCLTDAVEVDPYCTGVDPLGKKKYVKGPKRQKGVSLENFRPSTKVKALLGDLMQFSRANPHSVNYDPASIEIQMVDNEGKQLDDGVVKTVVFSQWTTMLDKVEDALEAAGIRYERLDGTMKRDERSRAMEVLKRDPRCEVLLVSLKAGGVGLNLTSAQRVYLMDPYWNPAVENQAVDRIHRLGQTRPVTTVKLIIENTIEARLLEVQRKKTELANMTLGQNYSKADMQQRRMEELNQLFGA